MSPRLLFVAVSFVLSVLIGLVLSQRGTETGGVSKGGGQLLVGLSLDTLKEARWQADRDRFVSRAEELGAKVNVNSANSDDSQQMRDVESLLTSGAKVLVIVPHDGVAMAKGVELANKAGVPVISYDRIIMNCDLDLYLSFDNVKVGELQAQFLLEHLPTPFKGKIVRIYGAPTDNNARLFKQGQDNVLKPYIERGDIVVVHEDWASDWMPENAKKVMNAAITKTRAFDAVLATNDGTAGGAIQSLIEEGLAGKIMVTGQDADLAACQRIAAGSQTMTIYKPIKILATTAADLAVDLARGKPVVARGEVNNGKKNVPAVLCPVVVVTKDNLVTTVIRDGYQSYDEVYRSVPESARPKRP
jgi:D-xylose transport system substrate-binding protein